MLKSLLRSAALAALIAGSAYAAPHPLLGVPEGANPGECFARVVVPAVTRDEPVSVVVQEGYETLRATEAQFEAAPQQILVKEAAKRYEVRQPTYRTVTETVVVRPEYERLVVEPAQFDTVPETVSVGQKRYVWKKGLNLSGVQRVDPTTGEIFCLVEEPGQTATVQKRVVRRPEQVRRELVPAQTTTVSRQVLADPGGVSEIPIPPEYRTMTTQRLVRAATTQATPVAPRTQTLTKRIVVQPERYEWVSVLCDTNAGPDQVKRIQSALAAQGFYQGPIDGLFGPGTSEALSKFQRQNGLAFEGYVTTETLARLGIGGSFRTSSISSYRAQTDLMSAPTKFSPTKSHDNSVTVAGASTLGAVAEQAMSMTQVRAVEPVATSARRTMSWN